MQPILVSLREEYYVTSSTSSTAVNTRRYPINPLALGLVLRELKYTVGDTIYDLQRIDPTTVNDMLVGRPAKFWLQGEDIVLYPTPDTVGTLTQWYHRRINKPVPVASAAQITQIDTITGVVTATPPTIWTTANTFDFISKNNGNKVLGSNVVATGITSTDITFTVGDLPSDLTIGDYISLTGETPFIQVPDDVIPLVQHCVVRDLLESMGDAAGTQAAIAKIERIQTTLGRIMVDRVIGAQEKFKPQY